MDTEQFEGQFEAPRARCILTEHQQHSSWLDDIQNILDRIKFENEMVPSEDSLFLHWQRSFWVIGMWKQADMNTMVLKPMTEFGW